MKKDKHLEEKAWPEPKHIAGARFGKQPCLPTYACETWMGAGMPCEGTSKHKILMLACRIANNGNVVQIMCTTSFFAYVGPGACVRMGSWYHP